MEELIYKSEFMTIEYLRPLEENPHHPNGAYSNTGYSVIEIQNLESLFNNGNNFPKAYREFLFLAGKYCWLFSGGGGLESLMRTFQRALNYANIAMDRPYVVFDSNNSNDDFSFIYLDEGVEDPGLYQCNALPEDELEDMEEVFYYENYTFSEYVAAAIEAKQKWFRDTRN